MDTPSPRIGLLMLVRDEAKILPLTLPSFLPNLDFAVVVDTGSEDDTKNVLTAEFERHSFSLGEDAYIDELPWVGFAQTRSAAYELAEAYGRGRVDYWLCLDADMLVEWDSPLPSLSADAYYLELPGPFRMSLPLLLKSGLDWRWEGAAHAGLVWPDNAVAGNLPNIRLFEQRTNSPRGDQKFLDDLQALEAELDPRTVFYYAQTLKDLGHPLEAADVYRFRIRLSARSPEDVFWACYQEGVLRWEAGQRDQAVRVLLEAYERRPTRAEPLWFLARHHRLAGADRTALMFAKTAAALSMPPDNGFVLAWVYDWGAQMELALCYQACGMTDDAIQMYRRLEERSRDRMSDEAKAFTRQQLEALEPAVLTAS